MSSSQHANPKSDIEIAQAATMRPIADVAHDKLGIAPEHLEPYGHYKAKIPLDAVNGGNGQGKLIVVTGITPTPAGEGKTTIAVGLAQPAQALGRLGVNVAATLREPSLGPIFGIKGGGTGGGKSLVVPEDEVNIHFTGDAHAVGSAHNLLAAQPNCPSSFGSLRMKPS